MKKKIIAILTTLTLTASMASVVMADDKITVFVNGNEVVFEDAVPFIENERTLVPMRAIFEAMGAQVVWDDEKKAIVSYDPVSDISITLQIGSNMMLTSEKTVELDVAAKIVDDRTFVPLRAVAEGMNSEVNWNGDKREINITK